MNLLAIITNLRFQDALDILFLTMVAYYLYLWFRGTKAFKALIGLIVLGIVFTSARAWGLFLTTYVFQIFWQVLVILLIILFQSEIRQVLERVNPLKAIGFHKVADPADWVPSFTKGTFLLASRRIGALIIIQRLDLIEEWITDGRPLNGDPVQEVLMSIFQKNSPLHDGAAVIRGGQIVTVSCYLPLSSIEGLPNEWGTRHRAAVGLTERCDAWVVIVSEERGEVSIARNGRIETVEKEENFSGLIHEAISPVTPQKRSWKKRLQLFVTNHWPVKLGSFALVCLFWIMLAGQQDFQVTLRVPLAVKNVPEEMEVQRPLTPEVQLTLRGHRKDASTLSERNVHVELDLSLAKYGKKVYSITRDQIVLPNDRIQVVRIEPSRLEFEFKKGQ